MAISMELEFTKVLDGQILRADLPEHERLCIQSALEDLFRRLSKHVHAASERLRQNDDGTDKTFRNTLVSNLRGIVDTIPLLNITNDPTLTSMAGQLAAMKDLQPDNLRSNHKAFDPGKREGFNETVDDTASQFAGYFGAP